MLRPIAFHIAVLCIACTPAVADKIQCAGTDPEWALNIDGVQAEFVFPATTRMDIPLVTRTENGEWPRAYTLIGVRDTAIVVMDRAACGDGDLRGHVLTQRGELPILLSGCCTVVR